MRDADQEEPCRCRFDLIYLVLDKAKREDDEKLARHLVSLYYEEQLPSAQVPRYQHKTL